mmetsp:Transcript_23773/g.76210  ORF Transcript_23773/g.76210 Transcript_23773/m.76210 type:complete len:364 (-) Transcript_23773:164-1255(-)
MYVHTINTHGEGSSRKGADRSRCHCRRLSFSHLGPTVGGARGNAPAGRAARVSHTRVGDGRRARAYCGGATLAASRERTYAVWGGRPRGVWVAPVRRSERPARRVDAGRGRECVLSGRLDDPRPSRDGEDVLVADRVLRGGDVLVRDNLLEVVHELNARLRRLVLAVLRTGVQVPVAQHSRIAVDHAVGLEQPQVGQKVLDGVVEQHRIERPSAVLGLDRREPIGHRPDPHLHAVPQPSVLDHGRRNRGKQRLDLDRDELGAGREEAAHPDGGVAAVRAQLHHVRLRPALRMHLLDGAVDGRAAQLPLGRARAVEVRVPEDVHRVEHRGRIALRRRADHVPQQRALAQLVEVRGRRGRPRSVV